MFDYAAAAAMMDVYAGAWYMLAIVYLAYVHVAPAPRTWRAAPWVCSAWNLICSIFSTCGLYAMATYIMSLPAHKQTLSNLFNDTEYMFDENAGPWVCAFVLSKIPELFDTVLVKCRGKQPTFLQWFHHVATMMYARLLYTDKSLNSVGLVMSTLNYAVHSVMYMYFALMASHFAARGTRLRSTLLRVSPAITVVQVLQMFVVLFMFWFRYTYLLIAVDWYGLLMYTVYAACFTHLLLTRQKRSLPANKTS